MMNESVRLLALQQQYEKESDGKVKFFGQSVSETIRTCISNGMNKKADRVKSEFKVPDKRSVNCVASRAFELMSPFLDFGI
jgi:hypothetical protein